MNNTYYKKSNRGKVYIASVLLLFFAFISAITLASAYFSEKTTGKPTMQIDVDKLFGELDPSLAEGEWGTKKNPYLIYENKHLQNLYILQNSRNIKAINKDTVFQVSNPDGSPCYVGGTPNSFLQIPSIGSEDFPFISTFKGEKTTDPEKYVNFNGYMSDTSVLGNIEVIAEPGQIDIGLFGNVGQKDINDTTGESKDIETTGYIGELLLHNIMVTTRITGDVAKTLEHPYPDDFFSTDPNHKESNHIGILAGHAQYTIIEKISVHYPNTVTGTGDNKKTSANITAFNIAVDDDEAKYTTAGGIIGFYKQIMVDVISNYPINSDGISPSNVSPGFGLGVLYSVDIWNYMVRLKGELNLPSYDIKDTFGVGEDKLYSSDSALDGLEKTFFRVGVFTLVHTREALGKDRIAKLWASDADEDPSKMWTVSNNGTYSLGTPTQIDSNAKKYNITQLTQDNLSIYNSGNTRYYYPSITAFTGINSNSYNNTRYRYMIVVQNSGVEYALVKNGESLTTQKIDTTNFIIPENMLMYYTFRVATGATYAGLTPDGRSRFTYGASTQLRLNSSTYDTYLAQYLLYGKTTFSSGSQYPAEEERPLRLFNPPSFVYSSATGTQQTATNEYSKLSLDTSNNQFTIQRYTATSTSYGSYLRYSVGNGFYGSSSAGTAVFKVYVVDTTSSTNAVFQKENHIPTGSTSTYDMSKHVLKYVSNTPYNDNAAEKYKYDLVSLADLNLPDNLEVPIEQINSALKMADPSSYYYLGGTYYGILRNIPVPNKPNNYIYAPRGSVAVRVNNTGNTNDKSQITIIVATDPNQLVDQEITISRFNSTNANGVPIATGTNISGITLETTFVLPSIPAPTVSGASRTTPIYVKRPNDNTYRAAYPNMQTLMVLYTFEVDVSGPKDTSTTYFLESSKGSASFVYFSVDKTATGLSNPTHENEAYFNPLNGIDYVADVFDNEKGLRRIATLNDSAYVTSLIMPFFGVTLPKNAENLTVVNARNFNYSITRIVDEEAAKKNQMHINIIVPDVTITAARRKELWELINFNFYDGTYFDKEKYERINSDYVVIYLNGTAIDWLELYSN